ncbi:exonuclease domain-containing protein [Planktosalinus lacus]|uniref:Exonuclease n=1 Tax=Planktosalinus lacus TaxID=1526573 RepID=A0A8J2VA30_9FLAO|nr:exonuclease domain-containing protein [Planktosalinus lacus]GGD91549.1 exonuclease [Planktosalinus lacus]
MYAILDIETTGGKYNEEGITEIAIYKFDGHKIVDQFISLVNPEIPIQPFVVNLTGINNEMLRQAPKFYEVAKRIVEITEDAIIVAHNAKFDYRILQTEFNRLGFEFTRETLCTVELSKKLLPDVKSYSLGKLVRELGIPMSDRHRASGDAKATVILFKLLLSKDSKKEIISNTIRLEPKRQLDSKLLDIIEKIPGETGVYYMHREDGKIIYIGKSKNIKKRIIQHFTSDNRKSKKIQDEVYSVSYEKTGSDLIAQLKESEEIKINKPIYNRALRKTIYQNQLNSYIDENGYINLKIEKADARKKPITTFTNYQQAKSSLFKITETYGLCQKLTGLYQTKGACFSYTIRECAGACIGIESPEEYNKKIEDFIKKNSFENNSFLVIDRGRDVDERSVVYVEKGIFKGIAFYNLNYQITNTDVLSSLITPMANNKDAQHIIQSYLRKYKVLKIIPL